MAIRVFLVILLIFISCSNLSFSLYEDQVGLVDWHQQYIGKVKHAVFHSQRAGRKRVVVSTEENVIASLDLRHGEIFWRHVLGTKDVVDGIGITLGKYVITLSSGGSILRAWNLPDGQMVWESFLGGSRPSKSLLMNLKINKDNSILVYGGEYFYAVSSIDGEILWRTKLADGSMEVHQVIQYLDGEKIYAVGFAGSSQIVACQVHSKSGELLKQHCSTFSDSLSGEMSLVSDGMLVALDSTRSIIVLISFQDGEISFQHTLISSLVEGFSGMAKILPSKLTGVFSLKINMLTLFIKVTDDGEMKIIEKTNHAMTFSNELAFADGQHAFALVQHTGNRINLLVKHGHDWSNEFLKESIEMDHQRGPVHKVFINNYVRTDKSHGFRSLIVMGDHSLLLVQQGVIVWCREDGLASIIDVTTSELPVEKKGVSVSKVEQNLFQWLRGHILKLKGSLMLANPEDVASIQQIRLQSSGKMKMTRDHNGFRKLLIVLTRPGKLYALHTGDGRVVWSLLLQSLCKSDSCDHPTGLSVYQWQVPHHHALDENPSVLIVGRCAHSSDSLTVLSFVDTYTGKELDFLGLPHSIVHVIPLPYTDPTEQRLHLLIDADKSAHLYPRTSKALDILNHEYPNIYWYSVEADHGVIRGHVLKSSCSVERADQFCFDTRDLWSIVFPLDSERIIATAERKLDEVVHTQAKVIAEQDVMYKYISKNIFFVATVSPKATGEIGLTTPEESWLVVYLVDSVTGRILHRMTHYGSQGPVHAVFSENWVVYHYFNLRAHRYEMSVIEIYDQSRAENRDVWKLVLGKHNLTSPLSSYSRAEIMAKSQSYFFSHSVKTVAVTSTAKGITSKQLLIGTVGDQVLALDKRFLDPRRSINPSQSEKEEGIIPLTDSLPIVPQSYVTHALKVAGLRGIMAAPARLESNTLIFAYGVDVFFTRIAPSRDYDSLTEDFSYALLLMTIAALVAAICVTWVLSEKKELQESWRFFTVFPLENQCKRWIPQESISLDRNNHLLSQSFQFANKRRG